MPTASSIIAAADACTARSGDPSRFVLPHSFVARSWYHCQSKPYQHHHIVWHPATNNDIISSSSSSSSDQPPTMKFVTATVLVAWFCFPSIAVAQKTYAEVALHAFEFDCWTIIRGTVYDLTWYCPRHDGGPIINTICGVDGKLPARKRASESSTSSNVGSVSLRIY